MNNVLLAALFLAISTGVGMLSGIITVALLAVLRKDDQGSKDQVRDNRKPVMLTREECLFLAQMCSWCGDDMPEDSQMADDKRENLTMRLFSALEHEFQE